MANYECVALLRTTRMRVMLKASQEKRVGGNSTQYPMIKSVHVHVDRERTRDETSLILDMGEKINVGL